MNDRLPTWLSGVVGHPHSIWRQQSGEKPSRKATFPSWPKPFNAIDKITVYNCNEIMALRVEFVAEALAEFWFDTNVPSPMELFRNWVFGQLRCGSKMGVEPHLPGPSDLILQRNGREVLMFAGQALGTGLFVWAMTQSVFSALNTYSSIMNVQAYCENPEARAILAGGELFTRFQGSGQMTLFNKVYDPYEVCNQVTGFILPPDEFPQATGWGTGTIINGSASIPLEIDVWLDFGNPVPQNVVHLSIGVLGSASFSVMAPRFNFGAAAIAINITSPSPFPGVITCQNAILSADWSDNQENAKGFVHFGNPPRRHRDCFLRFADGTPLP
ncbi:MAG TPA: hypothetical protein VFS35_04660 [Terrimicrobiaceae bacterium]|nr:hypothetical protein [Terrimicrobiaceae bacterium]